MIFFKNDYTNQLYNQLQALTGLYKQSSGNGSGSERKYQLICKYMLSVKYKQNFSSPQHIAINKTIVMFDTFSNMVNIVETNIIQCKILGMISIQTFSVQRFVEEYKKMSKYLFGDKFIEKQGQLHPNNAIKYRKQYARAKYQKISRRQSKSSKNGSDCSDKSVEIIPKKEQINKKQHEIPTNVITRSTKKKLQLVSGSQQSNEEQIHKIQKQIDKIQIEQKNGLDQKLSKKKIQIIKRNKLSHTEILLSESKQKQKQKQKRQRRRKNKTNTKQKLIQPKLLISIQEADKCQQASNKKKSGHGNQLKLNPIQQLFNKKIQPVQPNEIQLKQQNQQPTANILKQQAQKQKKQNENGNSQTNLINKISKGKIKQIGQQQRQKIQEEQEQTKIIKFLSLSSNSQSLLSNKIESVNSVDVKNTSTHSNNSLNMNNNKQSISLSNTVPNPAKSRSKKNKKDQPPPNNMRLDQFFKK